MKVGDKVRREKRYGNICLCDRCRPECWCRAADGWEITLISKASAQGGFLVKAKRDGRELPNGVSVSYFVGPDEEYELAHHALTGE